MAARMFGGLDAFRAYFKPQVPAGGPGVVDDIAEAVLYLASPQAKFVVGQVLLVDGGIAAR